MDMKNLQTKQQETETIRPRQPVSSGAAAAVRPEPAFVIDPANYKRRIGDGIDRRFTSIFLVTLFFHSILAFYFSKIPYEISIDAMRQFQEHYANFIYETKPEPERKPVRAVKEEEEEAKTEDEAVAEETAAEESDVAEAAPDPGPALEQQARERREANTRSTADIAQEASSKGLLALLSGSGTAAQGEAVVDLLGDGDSDGGKNLDEVFSGIDAIKKSGSVEKKGTSSRGSRVTDGGEGIGVAALTAAKSSKFGTKSGELVRSESTLEAIKGKTAGRDPEEVMKVVNSHASAIEYCYQRALRRDPSLKGKVSVRFTIQPSGSVSKVEIIESTFGDASIDRCISTKIKSWRDFGPIDPGKGEAIFRQDYIFGY